jgi:hypothetical protein
MKLSDALNLILAYFNMNIEHVSRHYGSKRYENTLITKMIDELNLNDFINGSNYYFENVGF